MTAAAPPIERHTRKGSPVYACWCGEPSSDQERSHCLRFGDGFALEHIACYLMRSRIMEWDCFHEENKP